jgi:hypothetical protein
MIGLEEIILIGYILDLAIKGFPRRLYIVEDIVNYILVIHNIDTSDNNRLEKLYIMMTGAQDVFLIET